MHNYVIVGYWANNFGDDLLLKVFAESFPDVSFKIIGTNKMFSSLPHFKNVTRVRIGGYRILLDKIAAHIGVQLPFTSTNAIIHECKGTDGVIELGGSIFILTRRMYVNYAIQSRKRMMKSSKSYYIIDANFGPFSEQRYVDWYANFFRKVDRILFRDQYSLDLFQQSNMHLMPDLALSLITSTDAVATDSNYDLFSIVDPKIKAESDNSFDYLHIVLNLIKDTVLNGRKVYLVSMCDAEGDYSFIQRNILPSVPAQQRRNVEVVRYDNLESMITLFQNANHVFASRFHAMILGWKFRKPTLVYAYSKKTIEHIETFFPEQEYFTSASTVSDVNKLHYARIPDVKLNALKSLVGNSLKNLFNKQTQVDKL